MLGNKRIGNLCETVKMRFASQTFVIYSQEGKKAAHEKAKAVVEELRAMKLKEAAKKVEDGIEETLTYHDFPSKY